MKTQSALLAYSSLYISLFCRSLGLSVSLGVCPVESCLMRYFPGMTFVCVRNQTMHNILCQDTSSARSSIVLQTEELIFP